MNIRQFLLSLFFLAFSVSTYAFPYGCITPQSLRNVAMSGGILDAYAAKSCKNIILNQWYSVGDNYEYTMTQLKDPKNKWVFNPSSYQDEKSVLCSYSSTTTTGVTIVTILKKSRRTHHDCECFRD